MKWFLNLKTRSKFSTCFGLMLLIMLIVVVMASTFILTIHESQKTLFEKNFVLAQNLIDLKSNMNHSRVAVLELLLATDPKQQEQSIQEIQQIKDNIEERMKILFEVAQNEPEFLRQLDELNSIRDMYSQTRDEQVIPLINEGKLEEAKALSLGIQNERYDNLRSLVLALGKDTTSNAQDLMDKSTKDSKISIRIFLIIAAIALLSGILMVLLMNRIIARPLKEVSEIAEQVAAGDLRVKITAVERRDELGILLKTFGKMVEKLREVTLETIEGINVLGTSTTEIFSAASIVASGAAETAAAVSETTSTVEEVRQTAQVTSQKAKYVSDSAQKTVQVSQAGKKAVEESIEGMNRIREQMESIAENILHLSEQSQTIGDIIAVVNDLADQSNLLAVNAAIEAAKAGEQGKGFGVVAQEVRRLAEQSKQATAQVRTILSNIVKSVSQAAMATEQGSKAVEGGVKYAKESGTVIQLLAESVTEAYQAATQITASIQQQLVGVDQVALAMENINQVSAMNVTSTKQVETAAQNMNEMGQKLKQLVLQYKV